MRAEYRQSSHLYTTSLNELPSSRSFVLDLETDQHNVVLNEHPIESPTELPSKKLSKCLNVQLRN